LKREGGRELVLQAIADARPVDDIAASDGAENEAAASLLLPEERTDCANARRLVATCGDHFRWCDPWQKYLVWDGCRWLADRECAMSKMAKDTASQQWSFIAQLNDLGDGEAKPIEAFAKYSSDAIGVRNALFMARSEPGTPVLPDALDRDPWLFNVENGTLDLRTGELRPHRREDLITKVAPVRFDPKAECPLWGNFLSKIMGDKQDLISFLQRLVGYSLTGCIRQHMIAMLYGKGANGKSTFISTVLALLGEDYALKASSDLLMVKDKSSHPTERASLHGKRFVACVESEDGRRFAESLVKELTGGDKISARRMREDFWEFEPTHKIWLATNHKPKVRGTDNGIWRRINLIPFTVEIAADEQDHELPKKLLDELPGILNWALFGCRAWQADGLKQPEDVTTVTNNFRNEMDVIGTFIAECCVQGTEKTFVASSAALYSAFGKWCEASGERAVSQRQFGASMTERGFDRFTCNGTFYRGIRLNQLNLEGSKDKEGAGGEATEGTEGTEGTE
jgi:putative DNA primase/helicase